MVVAEGAQLFELPPEPAGSAPVPDEDGPSVLPGPGRAAEMVADRLRARIDGEITPLVVGPGQGAGTRRPWTSNWGWPTALGPYRR